MSNAIRSESGKTRLRSRYLYLAILAPVAAFSVWLVFSNAMAVPANRGLVVKEQDLDFGEVWENKAFPWKFTIHNPTAEDIAIREFSSSCSCLVVEPKFVIVPARGKAEITVKLDLRMAFFQVDGAAGDAERLPFKRPFAVEVTPKLDDERVPWSTAWKVKGVVCQELVVSPPNIRVTNPFIQGEVFPIQRVRLVAQVPIESIHAVCAPEYARAIVSKTNAGSKDHELQIVLNPKMPVSSFRFKVKLETTLADSIEPGATKIVREIQVDGRVVEDAQVLPSPVFFGTKKLGETAETIVTVTSRSGQAVTIEKAEAGSPDTLVETRSPADHDGTKFLIRQKITQEGHAAGAVCFTVRKRDLVYTHVVPWSYYGLNKGTSAP